MSEDMAALDGPHLLQLRPKPIKVLFVGFWGVSFGCVKFRNIFKKLAPGQSGLAAKILKDSRYLKAGCSKMPQYDPLRPDFGKFAFIGIVHTIRSMHPQNAMFRPAVNQIRE
jgi:hypothetical protein